MTTDLPGEAEPTMPLDENDLKQIAALMTAGLKPVMGRLDKVEKTEPPDVAKLIAEAMKANKPADPKVDPKAATEADARFAAMEAKLKAATEATATADKARGQERMLSELRTRLGAANVPANRIAHAVSHLHHGQGRVSVDEHGATRLRFDRDGAGGAYTDELTLDKGLAEWLGTEDGKAFLPASDVKPVNEANRGPQYTTPGKDGATKVNGQALIAGLLNHARKVG